MFYIFHVDRGHMIKFEMNVALSRVQKLKETIEHRYSILSKNIVLLTSGGKLLTDDSLVGKYSAGPDTNPIYMFCTSDVQSQIWPSAEPDFDIGKQIELCMELPPSLTTVKERALLAGQIYNNARKEATVCEELVQDQILQKNGWGAVVANLEELTLEFEQRFEHFGKLFDENLSKRDRHLDLLNNFKNDLENLSVIPILPGLMQMAQEEFHGFDELLRSNGKIFSNSFENFDDKEEMLEKSSLSAISPNKKLKISNEDKDNGRSLTLLQWISAKSNKDALNAMAEECLQSLKTFEEKTYESVKTNVNGIIKNAKKDDYKEIKGLDNRLAHLKKMLDTLNKKVQDQKDLSASFQPNKKFGANTGDVSVLEDLCASHRSQLEVMLKNYNEIRDIRVKISKAKQELGVNLYERLKYIVRLENSMSDIDNSQLFHHRVLRRAEKHLEIIEQIHQTPYIYVSAVSEVVRRKIFSDLFLKWTSNLSCDFEIINSEEINRRKMFNDAFEGHFLNTLFPGMKDMPPALCQKAPLKFDHSLPNITKNDVELLATYLPDIAEQIKLPDMAPVINFFSINNCESETDTEEFENLTDIGKQTISVNEPKTIDISTSTEVLLTKTVETLTEENFNSTKLELRNMKEILKNISQISYECIGLLKTNLNTIRTDQNKLREISIAEIQKSIEELGKIHNVSQINIANRNLDVQLESLKKSDIEMEIHQRIKYETSLHEEVAKLLNKCDNLSSECEQLRSELEECKINKDKELTELRDRLIRKHKSEIDSLRCRYKLMAASVDQSPSDTCLDKFEKTENVGMTTKEEPIAKHQLAVKEVEKAIYESQEIDSTEQLCSFNVTNKLLNEKNAQTNFQEVEKLKNILDTEKLMAFDSKSEPLQKIAVLDGFKKGDVVVCVWNEKHGQYTILQESSNLFFVHGDCLEELQLRIPTKEDNFVPPQCYTYGKVMDKEYCLARKKENRYGVPKGTKFCRVKLAPLPNDIHDIKCERLVSIPSLSSSTSKHSQCLIDSFAQTESCEESVIIRTKQILPSTCSHEKTISLTEEEEVASDIIAVIQTEESKECKSLVITEQPTFSKENLPSIDKETNIAPSIGILQLIEPVVTFIQNMDLDNL